MSRNATTLRRVNRILHTKADVSRFYDARYQMQSSGRRDVDDPFNLQRFVDAQDPVLDRMLAELRSGRKRSHWMWFVFPQIAGLGNSDMNRRFAISSRDEADAYLKHPILGARLRDCTRLVNRLEGSTAHQIFGSPDDMKFWSSMTLFSRVAADSADFVEALRKYFDGKADERTLRKL